jgi:glycine cleavage system H protein
MATYKYDSAARYAKTHEWVRLEEGIAVVGISDTAQDLLSDVVYVELPEEGRTVAAGDPVAVVESVKAAEEVITPISGVVVAVNQALEEQPELVNEQPYEAWFFKIEPGADLAEETAALMDATAYEQFVAESA